VIASLQCTALDCSDALELAQFYQSLLGGVINQPIPGGRPARTGRRSTPALASCSTSSGWRTTSHRDGPILPTRSNST
jgi:hypothetical protein